MKKLMPALLGIVVLGVEIDRVEMTLSPMAGLNIPIPTILHWIPLILAVVVCLLSFFMLSKIRPNCERMEITKCVLALLVLTSVLYIGNLIPTAFKEQKVDCVMVTKEQLDHWDWNNEDWNKFQLQFNFKFIRIVNSKSSMLCFARVEGRAGKIEAALKNDVAK